MSSSVCPSENVNNPKSPSSVSSQVFHIVLFLEFYLDALN